MTSCFCSSVPMWRMMLATIKRGAHRVGGGSGPVELLHEGQHLEGVAALASELLGPSGGQPAPLDQAAVEVPVVVDPGPLHLVSHLVGEGLVQEVPGLLPEDLAALAQSEVHGHDPLRRADRRWPSARA